MISINNETGPSRLTTEASLEQASKFMGLANDALVAHCSILDSLAWEASGKAWIYHLEDYADKGMERLNELHDLCEALNWQWVSLLTGSEEPKEEPKEVGRLKALSVKAMRRMSSVEGRLMALAASLDSALPNAVRERAIAQVG